MNCPECGLPMLLDEHPPGREVLTGNPAGPEYRCKCGYCIGAATKGQRGEAVTTDNEIRATIAQLLQQYGPQYDGTEATRKAVDDLWRQCMSQDYVDACRAESEKQLGQFGGIVEAFGRGVREMMDRILIDAFKEAK
jgi:hypothetical protein